MEASNFSRDIESKILNSKFESTASSKQDFSQLRNLFNEFMNEIESNQEKNETNTTTSFQFPAKAIVRFNDER